MKPEVRFEAVSCMLREFAKSERTEKLAEMIISDPASYVYHPIEFYNAAASLLVDALNEMDKKTTKSTVKSAINAVLKTAKQNNARENQCGIYTCNGKFVVCDGYRAVRFDSDIPSLPHSTEPGADVSGLVENAIKNRGKEITLPSVGELKAYIATHRLGRRKADPFNLYGDIWVDPKFLLDMIQALPDCVAYTTPSRLSPIYFEGSNGSDGLLCPIKHN